MMDGMSAIDVLIEQRLSPQHARAVEEFAHAYLRRAGRDSEDGSGAEALYHEVLGAFELAAGRDRAPMAVRAFNPTLAEHGYQPAGSVLETSTEDLPFLVDSVTAELQARGLGVVRVAHPVVGTERDAGGAIARVLHPAGAPATESVMHFELDRRLDPEELAELEGAVRGVLADVRRVVRDFPAMRARLDEMIGLARAASARYDFDEVDETVAFLQWLAAENLILLGAREYELTGGTLAVVPGSGLGLLADGRPEPGAGPGPGLRGDDLLAVAKADALSPVHRRARMDDVSVQRVAPDGTVVGESRMLGLLTTKAYAEPAFETPLLARKLARILAAEDLIKGSHDYKAAVSLFESFPKDELLAAPVEDLRRAVVALMSLAPERIGVLGRRAADGRSASIIVALPKARYDAALLGRLRALLAARFDAEAIDAQEVLGEGDRVRVHVTVHRPQGGLPEVSLASLRAEVVELARTWDDRVRERLVAEHGPERGGALAARWAARLPPAYKAAIAPDAAALDIAGFERLFASGQPFTA
jgi:glutamate dehydrogenase